MLMRLFGQLLAWMFVAFCVLSLFYGIVVVADSLLNYNQPKTTRNDCP